MPNKKVRGNKYLKWRLAHLIRGLRVLECLPNTGVRARNKGAGAPPRTLHRNCWCGCAHGDLDRPVGLRQVGMLQGLIIRGGELAYMYKGVKKGIFKIIKGGFEKMPVRGPLLLFGACEAAGCTASIITT